MSKKKSSLERLSVQHMGRFPRVACDTETTGLNPWLGDMPFAFSFASPEGQVAYVQFPVDPFTREVHYDAKPAAYRQVKEFYENPKVEKIFWNAKFDVRMCRAAGIKVRGTIHEGMFAAHTCNSLEMSYGLKQLSKKYLKFPDDDQKLLQAATVRARRYGKKAGWKRGEEVVQDYWMPMSVFEEAGNGWEKDARLCQRYAEFDAQRTILLWLFYANIMEEEGLRETYDFEMRKLWPVVFKMEDRGVRLYRQMTKKAISGNERDIAKLLAEIEKLAWKGFNLNSPQQLSRFLYRKLKLPVKKRTKTGLPSTDVKALREHASNDVVRKVMAVRAMEKGVGYYKKYLYFAIPEKQEKKTIYIIHSSFEQLGPNTGRFASKTPNMQQVSHLMVHTDIVSSSMTSRNLFGPRPGYVWYLADYKQLEVRIFASESQEEFMIKALKEGRDLHGECANKIWGGKDNPRALDAIMRALDFYKDETSSDDVAKVWKDMGIRNPQKVPKPKLERMAMAWYKSFGYNIVKAEASVHRENRRSQAKQVFFGKIFGGGPTALMNVTGCSYEEAVEWITSYDEAFPGITEYMYREVKKARKNRCVYTAFGNRLSIDPNFAYRAVNYKVQGGAARLVKKGMVECDALFQKMKWDAHILLTVHDELVFEVAEKDRSKKLLRGISGCMSDHGGRYTLPTPVEIVRCNKYWSEKSEEIKL